MIDTNEAKRKAIALVKAGDAAGLARFQTYMVETMRHVEVQSTWAKNRAAKVALQHEAEAAKEAARVAKLDEEIKVFKALLIELKAMVVSKSVPAPTPAKPAPVPVPVVAAPVAKPAPQKPVKKK